MSVRTLVDKLVAAEMKRMPKPTTAASRFPDLDLFDKNPLLQQELDRVRRGKPMEPKLDLARYQLPDPSTLASSSSSSSATATATSSTTSTTNTTVPTPSSTQPSTTTAATSLGSISDADQTTMPSGSEQLPEGRQQWLHAVANANAQLEHQAQRIVNLELVQKFGSNAWNIHNYQMEYSLSLLRNAVDAKRTEVIELNKLRKRDQLDAAESLQRMEAKWAELISSTLQVEVASASLEAELAQLKAYEANLAKELGLPLVQQP
ncbi:hypothetical protein BGZ99_005664 [Dissophora globulifera]|uniref:Pre-mRNA-splicing factor SPF27 n=1 Tax=Dissophora globulifera TaxID=979702 RepID=A0A9P6RTC8_9FUNG|nr:hypothetical protein BGZ99_005664 [Dissophora globulifera]